MRSPVYLLAAALWILIGFVNWAAGEPLGAQVAFATACILLAIQSHPEPR